MLVTSSPRLGAPVIKHGSHPSPRACRADSSRFPIVALIAHVWSCGRCCRNQLRASSAWIPRLLPISSCHSSRTTVSSVLNSASQWRLASRTHNDSGVVIRISGGFLIWRLLSALGVSPLRIPTRRGQPIASIGCCSATAKSRPNALSGVM